MTYLDFAATTPLDDRVLDAMMPFLKENFGNSSSIHKYGQNAEKALEESRQIIANILNSHPNEIIFTSCGSESDNLALRGVALATQKSRNANHILISPVEHHAISKTANQLAQIFGFELEYLPVDEYGIVHPECIKEYIRSDTAIVSVIYANNEIGSINPISSIGDICQQNEIPFHTDAVQAAAYLPIDTQLLNIDLLSIGAHKFYGPKGIGALYIKNGTRIIPQITGGSQESSYRAGTHNIAYIVGLAKSFSLVVEERKQRNNHVTQLRDQLIIRVLEDIDGSFLTGHPVKRMPNHASFVFDGINGNDLLMMLDIEGFACSSGSACKTGAPEPSEVLIALGIPYDLALGSLRITLGTTTSQEHIDKFLDTLKKVVFRLR